MLYFTYREQYSFNEVVDMWQIKIVDIGGDGLVTEFNSTLETLAEVEVLVINAINTKLCVCTISLEHVDELVYSVWLCGHEIGVVAIRDINPAPVKRK